MEESYDENVFGIESFGTGGTDGMGMARGHGSHEGTGFSTHPKQYSTIIY